MKSTAARTVVVIIGGLAVLVGGVWIGQGAGLIKGSFMTGSAPGWPSDCYVWSQACS